MGGMLGSYPEEVHDKRCMMMNREERTLAGVVLIAWALSLAFLVLD
jgi:hypothetical protein